MKHSKTEIALLTISVVFIVVMLIVPRVGPHQLAGRRLGLLRTSPDDAIRPVGPAPDPDRHGRRRHRQYYRRPRCGLGYFQIRLPGQAFPDDPHRYTLFHLAGHRRPGLHHDLRPHGLDRSVDRSPQRLLGDGYPNRLCRSRRHLGDDFRHLSSVFREIIPVLSTNGRDEEEAAALMGASGWTIFFRITLPQIKWALLYGIVLCTARALGEFGAVSALSKLRGETFTLPLEIDALYQSGSADAITAAFAVSSLLVLLAIIVLLLRTFLEAKADKTS